MMRQSASKRSAAAGRALVLVPALVLAIAGCAQIIGLDGYTVASGGTGGTGPSGGSGGTVSVGGNGGKASGGGGSTSVAGTSGEAGAIDAGGTGGGTPSTTALGCDGKTSFTLHEDIIRSCILRAGCAINPVPVRTISECVTKNTQLALPGESCNLTSRTCADYEACEHTGIAHDDLCGGTATTGTRCENGLAINCGNYATDQFYDCKAQGETCGTYTYTYSDNTTALYADCKLGATTPADACAGLSDDSAFYCQPGSGNTPDYYYYCYQGQPYGTSCSKFATCYDTTATSADGGLGSPDATCYFNFSAQCTGQPDSATCAGGVAKLCSSEDVISYDCSSVGLDCATKGTDGYCVAPGCRTADVDTCKESCDGTTLNFCYGGVSHSIDCTAYGFDTCNQDVKTNSDNTTTQYANCR